MLSQREGAYSRLEDSDKFSFSKDVAETLGLETAIILELYQKHKSQISGNSEKFLLTINQELPFISQSKIKSSFDKLLKYKLIDTKVESIKNSNSYNVKEAPKISSKTKIDSNWAPSSEATEILKLGGISESFYLDKLKEYKLYWLERGQERNNWNTSFIDFIRREWAKEQSSNKGLPYVIDSNWIPSDDVYDILELSDISKESASKYLPEFILYWKENGSAFTTWNSKFIEHVKRRHLGADKINDNEKNKKYIEPGKYKKDFSSRKSDSSWASEINLD